MTRMKLFQNLLHPSLKSSLIMAGSGLLLLGLSAGPALAQENKKIEGSGARNKGDIRRSYRDPFLPPHYKDPNQPQPTRRLSEAELKALAQAEQEKIKSILDIGGEIKHGDTYYVIIDNKLVKAGDILDVDVDGHIYHLLIKSLSKGNVRLEPYKE